jgi:outer membrane receptor for ferric coprogen and ferric-rhodotorulic acid
MGVGYRHDKLEQITFARLDENNAPILNEFGERINDFNRWDTNEYTGRTKTIGAVFHLTQNLRLMYNQSDNFGVPNSSRRRYPDGGPADNTIGEGRDFGIGFRLWNNRISGRITRFETDSQNTYRAAFNLSNANEDLLDALVAAQNITGVTQEQANAMFINGTGATVDQHVEGYEFSVVANITNNWRLRAVYSFTEGYQTNSFPDQREYRDGDPDGRLGGFGGLTFFEKPAWAGIPLVADINVGGAAASTVGEYIDFWKAELAEQLAVDGVTLPRNRPHKASLFTNYSFTEGALRNLTVSLGARYQSAAELGFGLDANGTPFALMGNGYWMTTGMLGYTFRNVWKLETVRVQLNVDNLFDFSDYIITGRDATTQAITKVMYLTPRAAKLSVSFSF